MQSSSLAEPGKSDVLFELGVKEQQFEKALAAALEISFQTTVAAETPGEAAERRRVGDRRGNGCRARGRGARPRSPSRFPDNPSPSKPASSIRVRRRLAWPESTSSRRTGRTGTSIRRDATNEAAGGKEAQWRFAVTAPPDAALTRPYFTRPNDEQPYYDLTDQRYRNLPLAPYPLAVRARLLYRGVPFEVAQVVQTSERVPGFGTLENPLLVGPAISVWVSPSAGAVPVGSKSFAFTATVHSNVKGPAGGTLRLKLPGGWRATPAEAEFSLARDGEDQTVVFSVAPDLVRPAEYTITAVAEYKGREYSEGYHLTGYPGLRPYPYYRPATYKAVGVDVKTAPGLKIGFLPGTGDDVPTGSRKSRARRADSRHQRPDARRI